MYPSLYSVKMNSVTGFKIQLFWSIRFNKATYSYQSALGPLIRLFNLSAENRI